MSSTILYLKWKTLIFCVFFVGQHGGVVVTTIVSQQEGPGWNPLATWDLPLWNLYVLTVPG